MVPPRQTAGWQRERARARLEPLLSLAQRIRDPQNPLGREVRDGLAGTSSLSPSGTELALTEHLETEVSDADLDALAMWCTPAASCHVVLSALVCTAALRAIALALVTSDAVYIKPSRRDPVLASVLVRELQGLGISIALLDSTNVDLVKPRAGDQVHAYGSEHALASIRAALPQAVHFRGHGPGFGVAMIGDSADLEAAAAALARDVVVFDQRGCLSPRVALVTGSVDRAERFGALASRALAALAERVPAGALAAQERAELATFIATMQAIGHAHVHDDHVVAFDPRPETLLLPPAARALVVSPFRNETLDEHQAWITCIGRAGTGPTRPEADQLQSRPEEAAQSRSLVDDALRPFALSGARITELGKMQRPPLDGPVDRRR